MPITLAQLQAQGNEADIDGTVNAFVIKAVSSGSLRLGATAATATAWNALSNNTVDSGHTAYWTPAANANGLLNAFTAVAKDNSGAESATAIQAKVSVAPVNDAPTETVTFTGNPVEYQTLTAANTLVDVEGFSPIGVNWGIGYQWLANGMEIGGAQSATFTLGKAQVGKSISVRAGYIDSGNRREQVVSAAALVANVNDAPTGAVTFWRAGSELTATDLVRQGDVLSVGHTLADADGMGPVNYQWLANGIAIAGATAASLTVTQAQIGKSLSVKATYTDDFGTAETVMSAATGTVVSPPPTGTVNLWRGGIAVTNTTTVQQGDTLSATNTLVDTEGVGALSYQWQVLADGTHWDVISGANAGSLTLTSNLAGKSVRVKAMYTDGVGTAESVNSAGTALVNWAIGTAGADTLAGTAGADVLRGRAGDDTYIVNNAGDLVYEELYEGIDTVMSSVDYTLTCGVENLVLVGGAALNGTGIWMDESLTGNSGNNVLVGGVGSDTLIGEGGDDVLDEPGLAAGGPAIVNVLVTSDTTAEFTVDYLPAGSATLANGILPAVAAGQTLVLQGGGGDGINIYATPGSNVDLRAAGMYSGSLHLSGQLADYNQAIDQDTGTYTFSRDLPEGQSETAMLKVSHWDLRLYFADGYIVLNGLADKRLAPSNDYWNPGNWEFHQDYETGIYIQNRMLNNEGIDIPIRSQW